MSKSNTMENNLLKILFQAVSWSPIATQHGSGITSLRLSLHTSDPGEAGDQTTNETSYGAYARVSVGRTTTGWKVTGNVAYPRAAVSFPQATSGTATITHFGIGTATSGTGQLLYSGTVTPNIAIAAGVTPSLTTGSSITES
jgi:hypothetical protein